MRRMFLLAFIGITLSQSTSAAEPYAALVPIIQKNGTEAQRAAVLDRSIREAGIDAAKLSSEAERLLAIESFTDQEEFEDHIDALSRVYGELFVKRREVKEIYDAEQIGKRLVVPVQEEEEICDWRPYKARFDETLKQAGYPDTLRTQSFGGAVYEATQDQVTKEVRLVLFVRGHLGSGGSEVLRELDRSIYQLEAPGALAFRNAKGGLHGIRDWQAKRDQLLQLILRNVPRDTVLQAQFAQLQADICAVAERIGIHACEKGYVGDLRLLHLRFWMPEFSETQGEEFKVALMNTLQRMEEVERAVSLPSFEFELDFCVVNPVLPGRESVRYCERRNENFLSDESIAMSATAQANDSLQTWGTGLGVAAVSEFLDETLYNDCHHKTPSELLKAFTYVLGGNRTYRCTPRHGEWSGFKADIKDWIARVDRKVCALRQEAQSATGILSEEKVRTY